MTNLLRAAIIGVLSALASAAFAQAQGNDREIRERIIYHDGGHVFVAPENGKSIAANETPSNGAWKLAGDPLDRPGMRGSDIGNSREATAIEQPTGIATSDDRDEAGAAEERETLDYIALALLIFIAVWSIAYRRDPGRKSGIPSANDRAEALDARLTYMDQRLADIERRVRRKTA